VNGGIADQRCPVSAPAGKTEPKKILTIDLGNGLSEALQRKQHALDRNPIGQKTDFENGKISNEEPRVDEESVSAALDALAKAGVRTLGGGTMAGSDPFGIVMVGEDDQQKALDILRRVAIPARLG
jgi:hypothetical protein